MDIATVDPYQSEISILLGNGDGTFQAHQEYLTGNQPVELATADVNGDGILDIIVADYHDEQIAVLLGNGDGIIQVSRGLRHRQRSFRRRDWRFQWRWQARRGGRQQHRQHRSVLLGNGDGTFQGAIPFPTAVGANSVVIGDFNGDDKLDLAVGTSNKQVSVLLGNGDGTFQNHKEYSIGANAVIVATADMNADGKLDLVSANFNDNTVSLLLGNGDGTFKGRVRLSHQRRSERTCHRRFQRQRQARHRVQSPTPQAKFRC